MGKIDKTTYKINLSFATRLIQASLSYTAKKKGDDSIIRTVKCPFLIKTSYVYRGSRFLDRSLYFIYFEPYHNIVTGKLHYKPESFSFVRTFSGLVSYLNEKGTLGNTKDSYGSSTWIDSSSHYEALRLNSVLAESLPKGANLLKASFFK